MTKTIPAISQADVSKDSTSKMEKAKALQKNDELRKPVLPLTSQMTCVSVS